MLCTDCKEPRGDCFVSLLSRERPTKEAIWMNKRCSQLAAATCRRRRSQRPAGSLSTKYTRPASANGSALPRRKKTRPRKRWQSCSVSANSDAQFPRHKRFGKKKKTIQSLSLFFSQQLSSSSAGSHFSRVTSWRLFPWSSRSPTLRGDPESRFSSRRRGSGTSTLSWIPSFTPCGIWNFEKLLGRSCYLHARELCPAKEVKMKIGRKKY